MKGFRSVSIPEDLVKQVEQLIDDLGTYGSKAEFIREAVRLRLEALERHQPTQQSKEEQE